VVTAGAAFTVMLKACVAVTELVSVSDTVKLAVPAVVAVPEITPVEEVRLSPPGRFPEIKAHVSDPVPPDPNSVCEYDAPAVVPVSGEVPMDGAGFTVQLNT
jgi:hypothetical protein